MRGFLEDWLIVDEDADEETLEDFNGGFEEAREESIELANAAVELVEVVGGARLIHTGDVVGFFAELANFCKDVAL